MEVHCIINYTKIYTGRILLGYSLHHWYLITQNSGGENWWNECHSPIFYPELLTVKCLSYCKFSKVLINTLKQLIFQGFIQPEFCAMRYSSATVCAYKSLFIKMFILGSIVSLQCLYCNGVFRIGQQLEITWERSSTRSWTLRINDTTNFVINYLKTHMWSHVTDITR